MGGIFGLIVTFGKIALLLFHYLVTLLLTCNKNICECDKAVTIQALKLGWWY